VYRAFLLANDLLPPAVDGYVIVLVAPLGVGVLVYRLLVAYYRHTSMSGFLSVLVYYLGYRRRGWILIPTILALPVGYVASVPLVPTAAGNVGFAKTYESFLLAAATMTSALLIALALQLRSPSRQARFVTREADLVAVVWTAVAEAAVLALLSPSLPMDLQRPSFSLMLSGTAAGLVALILGATRTDEG